MYQKDVVQLSVTINYDLTPTIKVNNRPCSNDFMSDLPRHVTSKEDLKAIIDKLDGHDVCLGNHEEHFQHLL